MVPDSLDSVIRRKDLPLLLSLLLFVLLLLYAWSTHVRTAFLSNLSMSHIATFAESSRLSCHLPDAITSRVRRAPPHSSNPMAVACPSYIQHVLDHHLIDFL